MGTRASIAAILVGALIFLAACGGEEEEFAPTSTTPTAAPTAAPTDGAAPTATATPSVPADWLTFASPDGLFTLRYPPQWFIEVRPTPAPSTAVYQYIVAYLFSVNPQKVGIGFPPDGSKVDLSVSLPDASACPAEPAGATVVSLGGVTGWRFTRSEPNDFGQTADAWGVSQAGQCFTFTAYFGPQNHDQPIFEQVMRSLVLKGPSR